MPYHWNCAIGWWGQGQHNKPCLVKALISRIRPSKTFELNLKKNQVRTIRSRLANRVKSVGKSSSKPVVHSMLVGSAGLYASQVRIVRRSGVHKSKNVGNARSDNVGSIDKRVDSAEQLLSDLFSLAFRLKHLNIKVTFCAVLRGEIPLQLRSQMKHFLCSKLHA